MNVPKQELQFGIPGVPFPVGVEYYRAPTPKRDVWDADLARIRAAGFRIIRSHSYWNWMEPAPGRYELDDFDAMFDLAEKHGLFVWMDIMLATHGACPEWLIREYPDLPVVNYLGQKVTPHAGPAYPQGGAIHCYDHPAWREHGGRLLRHIVHRYKDRPNLLVWGLWDAINLCSSWSRMGGGYPCCCPSTLSPQEVQEAGSAGSVPGTLPASCVPDLLPHPALREGPRERGGVEHLATDARGQ